MINPGTRFSKFEPLTAREISRFARMAGDLNPLHHDHEFARSSPYGKIIASGLQTSALLMAFTASYFSKIGFMSHHDFNFNSFN